jgi:hypothetical protein
MSQAEAPTGPAFPIGGPSSMAWREEMLAKAQELSGLASWIAAHPNKAKIEGDLRRTIDNEIETARLAARGRGSPHDEERLGRWGRLVAAFSGAAFERTLGNLDAVEANLLRLAPEEYLRGELPSLRAHINRFLPKDDPRRLRVDELKRSLTRDRSEPGQLTDTDRDALVAAFHAANSHRRRELARVRSFRNLLFGGALTLFVLAILLAVLGAVHRELLPLCFLPEEKKRFVCPLRDSPAPNPDNADIDKLVSATARGGDILVVEVIGLVAATLAGAIALRRMRGTSTPYAVPVALILLKLPAGALTAVLGLLFMRGGFVPGLSALDTSAQILAWAIIFGYSQQLFTRLVDTQGQNVLHDVAGQGPAGDRETRSR